MITIRIGTTSRKIGTIVIEVYMLCEYSTTITHNTIMNIMNGVDYGIIKSLRVSSWTKRMLGPLERVKRTTVETVFVLVLA